ncbi:UDP-N-acetylmuramoyl-L-alanyl-D-glutamate--2,6-diaminopimelate ligase [Candidatus Gottesmanbacteria bacterium]|nr:UDP-N-acetylmuramoyl-L-alanyl-D-glutamate--2,6-diaminopimelate ligase [Candidatus Gottesmanbacteria bacterium]
MIVSLKRLYHLLIAIFSSIKFGFPARKLIVVGVTGTDGKTTTTTLIYEILKKAGMKTSMISSVHAVIGDKTYDTGFHVTTPNAYYVQKYLREAVDHGDTHMVLEVTSHALTQHRVFGIHFAVGVLTNVTHEHLDWHKTMSAYQKAKLSLLLQSKIAVVNRDDAKIYQAALPKLTKNKIVSYGILRDAKVTPLSFPYQTKLMGEFNRYNCLAAIAATSALGVQEHLIREVVKQFSGIPGRMEVITKRPFMVIVDFAHTPNAIEQVLKTVRPLTKGRLIHVFGAAALRDASKRPFMGEASGRYSDVIILTEEDYRTEEVTTIMGEIASGIAADKEIYKVSNRREAIALAFSLAKPRDLVIITGKGHEKSLARGNKEYPWSDQKAVREILKQRSYAHKKT